MTRSLAQTLNALGLCAIALVLAVAFAAQLLLDELPCPLCLLQRIQFAMLAVGPILNVRFGPRPSHYALERRAFERDKPKTIGQSGASIASITRASR